MPTIIFEFGRAFLHAFQNSCLPNQKNPPKTKKPQNHTHAADYSSASYAMGPYNTFARSERFKNLEQQGRKNKFLKYSSLKS